MSKLNQGELLTWLNKWFAYWDSPLDEPEQAYQQIKQIINLHFSDEWQRVKKDLGKFMQEQKPRVTEEWIEETMGELFKKYTIGFPTPKAIKIFTELLKLAEKI